MIEEFEYKGIWWLPDKPKVQISGTLRFTPGEGAVLDLIGSLKDLKDMDRLFNPEIVLGFSEGKEITLHRCFETQSKLTLPGFLTSSYFADTVLLGVHFQKKEEVKFKELSIHYSYLDEWVNISGFDIQHAFDKDEVVIKYKQPETIQTVIDGDFKIFIYIKRSGPTESVVQKEATIRQKTYIKIEPPEERHFGEYLSIMYHIQNLLSLGIMAPVYPLDIEGKTELRKQMIGDKTYYPPVKIFYRLPDIPKGPKRILPFQMLFTFKDISNRFDVFLNNWFEKSDLLEPVYDLYFGTLYNPRMYLRHRFLSLIHAIESFHQRIYGGGYLSDEDYKKVYNALVNAIPDGIKRDFRDSLKGKLKYGHNFSLRKRLKEILDKYQEIVSDFIKDKNGFINKVVDTRNYLVHYDQKLKDKAASGEELFRLVQKLKIMVEICLLTELGFGSKEIKALFSKNRRYQ